MINDSKLAEGSQTKPLAEYSDAEPSIRRFPYAGWIPTANGRLSFRHIGESSHPTSSSCTNISVQDSARYILATQVRPLSDVLFQKVSHPLLGLDGNIPFVLTARSYQAPPHDHTIFGRISIFSSKSSWQQRKVDGSPNSKTILKDSITKINDQRQTYSKLDKNLVTQTWKEARSELSSHSEVSVFFKLLRTGEVYFSKPLFTDKVLEDNTIRFADKSGHDFYLWIANQAFFFLRDICHKHQHHDAHSDTILVLQKRSLIDPL